MPTTRQEAEDFANTAISSIRIDGKVLLRDTIVWIGDNLNPDDIFSYDDLKAWAAENGYVKE